MNLLDRLLLRPEEEMLLTKRTVNLEISRKHAELAAVAKTRGDDDQHNRQRYLAQLCSEGGAQAAAANTRSAVAFETVGKSSEEFHAALEKEIPRIVDDYKAIGIELSKPQVDELRRFVMEP